MSEVRWIRGRVAENATREPDSPAEADPCAVKRWVPRSPSPGASLGERARRKPRKDAGNATGASARSRSSWEAEVGRNASKLVLLGVPQGRPGEDGQAPRKPFEPLTRTTAAHPDQRVSRERRSGTRPKAWNLVAEALGNQRPSGTVRGRHAGTSKGRHDERSCPASKGVGYA